MLTAFQYRVQFITRKAVFRFNKKLPYFCNVTIQQNNMSLMACVLFYCLLTLLKVLATAVWSVQDRIKTCQAYL